MLYLLPNVLSETQNPRQVLSKQVEEVIATLDGVFCESEKKARWYLKHFTLKMPLQQFPLVLLNEHTTSLSEHLQPLVRGETWAILSDAGVSCVADPGSELVKLAHEQNIAVQTIFGPCSIIQSLQLSGMGGQRFCFHGYLPREKPLRQEALRKLEKASSERKETQICIEAPYRNVELLTDCLQVLKPETKLCVAWELDSPNAGLIVQNVSVWKQKPLPDIHKKPAIFLFLHN